MLDLQSRIKSLIDNKLLKGNPTSHIVGLKEISDEEFDQATSLLVEHNNNADPNAEAFYIIDVTGKHGVYFTFWRYREIDPKIAMFIKNPVYIQNLTTNLLSAIQKAIALRPNIRIELDNDTTNEHVIGKPMTFSFGKYRGMNFIDVYNEKPDYFVWLDQNADPKYAHTPNAQAIYYFAQMAREEITKKNQETSTSKFVGEPGQSYNGELTIYKYDVRTSEFRTYNTHTTTVSHCYTAADSDGNKFKFKITNNKLDKYFGGVAPLKDSVVKLKGVIEGHEEYLGVKFTFLKNLKPQ